MTRSCCLLSGGMVLAVCLPGLGQTSNAPLVEDVFGRRLDAEHALVLVDWEGYLANPAMEIVIGPPEGAALPARAVLSAAEPRLYFNLPSQAGPHGPHKEIAIGEHGRRSVLVSIFPDRDGEDEVHELKLEWHDSTGVSWSLQLPIHVVDQDRSEGSGFPAMVDFSHDQTGFFEDDMRRRVVIQAMQDWMYFLDGTGLDPIAAGAEQTFIWNPDGFINGKHVANATEYTGFLLYVYGIQGVELRSGGEPSRAGGFQSVGGKQLPLRRSGGVEVETRGNYNELGWLVSLDDAEWWRATNLRDVPNDLYSIVHHEMGHALFSNAGYPLFRRAKERGVLEDERVAEYLGAAPRIDRSEHFPGTVDPASRRGAFGNEYHGEMPRGRWLITKADLLLAQAVGHRLRPTSAFAPLTIETDSLPAARKGEPYRVRLRASGGIPFYDWELASGQDTLPPGFQLDAYSGELHGVAGENGRFEFRVRVRDYNRQAAAQEKKFLLHVQE
ncbi:MAG: hypothetical protein K6T86_03580 [Pirellulales bacterium]|nr:hypothetical protein [Pirellulales bacterium]